MKKYTKKLVVLRGNSGSGKSTVAKALRESARSKVALVEKDNLRRIIAKEKDNGDTDIIALIQQTVEFALSRGYNVILEGIFYVPRYSELLSSLATVCPNNYFYYFDISLDETIKRHLSKPNTHDFGEKEIREWYKPNQATGFETERIIPETSSVDETIAKILADTDL